MTTKKQNTEFGLVASLTILVVSVWYGLDLQVIALITLLVSLLIPKLYAPIAWLWFVLAKALERLMTKVILLLVFFIVVTPVALLRRVLGKENLLKERSKNKTSLFENHTHTFRPEDMINQF